MTVTKKTEVRATNTIIRLFTEKYNELAKQGKSFSERKYIIDFIESEKNYLKELSKLKDDATENELDELYFKTTNSYPHLTIANR